MNIYKQRIFNQRISKTDFKTPAEVLSWLGAIQGQDFAGAKWSIGLRLPGTTESEIENAMNNMNIVRTWLMRGTLHIASANDIRWILELLEPKIIKGGAGRFRQLELDEATFKKSRKIIIKILQNKNHLTRNEIFSVLNKSGIYTTGQRGIHIIWKFALDGLICFGPLKGRQQTFVLLDEFLPETKKINRDDALAELSKRYFFSRGPATIQDFVWWSGLKLSDAKIGFDSVSSKLNKETIHGQTYWFKTLDSKFINKKSGIFLLPGFDEYLLGYKDRYGTLEEMHAQKICPGKNGIFNPTIVKNGQIVGIWKRTFKKKEVVITPEPFLPFSEKENRLFGKAAIFYGRYLEISMKMNW